MLTILDYSEGLDGLPKLDVLTYLPEDNRSVVECPFGTEPKLKTYMSVRVESRKAELTEAQMVESLKIYFE